MHAEASLSVKVIWRERIPSQESSIKMSELKYHLSQPRVHRSVHMGPERGLAQRTLKKIALCGRAARVTIELQAGCCSTLPRIGVWPESGGEWMWNKWGTGCSTPSNFVRIRAPYHGTSRIHVRAGYVGSGRIKPAHATWPFCLGHEQLK